MASTDNSSCIPLKLSRNIVVAGEAGVGKSSFINLVVGSDVAVIGNDVFGVTTKKHCHSWDTLTHSFRLWDTPGLDEGSFGSVSPKDAQHVLRSLLEELEKDRGVHLLVICMRRASHITKNMQSTYRTILGIRDKVSPKLPIVAVITEMEKDCSHPDILSSMEGWWSKHSKSLSDLEMVFHGHACITTLPDGDHPPMPGRRDQCQKLVRDLVINHSLPFVRFTRNIVVVGEIGAGKSSVINLVLDRNSATVRSDADAVTVRTSFHDWDDPQKHTYRLWDTPGLGNRPPGGLSERHAENALQSLLTELSKGSGVQLIIFCVRGGSASKIRHSAKAYKTVATLRDHLEVSYKVPIVAVVTESEMISTPLDVLSSMEKWWTTNSPTLSNLDVMFTGHACITTLPDDCLPEIPGRRDQCQQLVRDLIVKHSLTPTVPQKDLHIVLFGETGVGKSSIVNLLAGWQVAAASPDSVACTLDSTEYQFQLGTTTIRLWDTVGLEEPEMGTNRYITAIEKAIELTQRLNASGGISLFVYCIRGGRVTATMQNNYRLFYEILGKKRVPIVLAITWLEREPNMEEWWERNKSMLENNGIAVQGHACITTLRGHSKYFESRNKLQDLFWQYADQKKFSVNLESWIERLLKGLRLFLGISFPKGKDLTRILVKRCHMEVNVAQRLASRIESADDV